MQKRQAYRSCPEDQNSQLAPEFNVLDADVLAPTGEQKGRSKLVRNNVMREEWLLK